MIVSSVKVCVIPGSGGFTYGVGVRVLHNVDHMIRPMCPWRPPPYGEGREAVFVYNANMSVVMAAYVGSPVITGKFFIGNLDMMLLKSF